MKTFLLLLFSLGLTLSQPSKQNKSTTYQRIVEVIKLSNKPFSKNIDEKSDFTEWFSSQSSSIWDEVKEYVDDAIHQENFTSTLISQKSNDIEAVSSILNKGKNLALDTDLKKFLSEKAKFFPQHRVNQNVSFDPNWITLIIYYMRASSLIHLELMRPDRNVKKRLHKCALHDELGLLREDVIGAAKQLYKLRYQNSIKGQGAGNLKSVQDGILLDSDFIPKYQKNSDSQGYLTFFDTFSNDSISLWLPHVKHYFLDTILKGSLTVAVERLTMFYNSLIGSNCDEIMVNDGCLCPKMIVDNEVRFSYPEDCFGKVKNRGIECRLPCLEYDGADKYMCVFGAALETGSWYVDGISKEVLSEKPDRYSYRDVCDPPEEADWDKCMNIPKLNKNTCKTCEATEEFINKQKKVKPKAQPPPRRPSRLPPNIAISLAGRK